MTRNQNIDCREHTAKVIFKNSMNTLHTYSKTYSGASQIYTKSLLFQLKQNLPKDNYYENNGTVKRDLSIETDICILRRYCKNKRNILLNREVVSAKSKYSINRTEIDTIDEFQHDTSACGDSEQNVHLPKTCFNINLTSLVIDNLKDLLSDWIKTYLLEKKETKQKIDSVLDSILHKLDLQRNDHDTSSSYTYTVDVEVINRNLNQKTELQSNRSKDFALENSELVEETSNLSIPLNGKYLRIISTLSLPRNTHKTKRRRNSRHNMKRIRHKKVLLSTSKSSNYIFKSSKLDFLTLPTKSLTKHCVTYEHDETNELKAKNIIPQSLSSTKELINDLIHSENMFEPTVCKIRTNRPLTNSNKIKNFIKSVYSDNSQITQSNSKSDQNETQVDSNDKNKIQGQKSLNELDQSEPLIAIDLVTQSFESQNKNKQSVLKLRTIDGIKTNKDKYRRSNRCKKQLSRYQNYKSIKTKQFTYLFRKSNNLINQEKTLLKHFQSIFRYFSSWEGKKDIKVDIQVNVFPTGNKEGSFINSEKNQFPKPIQPDVLTCTDDQKIDNKVTTEKDVTSYDKQNIISLLDGAASQAKYIISRETSTDTSETNNKVDNEKSNLNIKHSKIAQEINELKIIIKSLAAATEKIATDHLQRKQDVLKQNLSQPLNNNNMNELVTKTITPNTIKSSKCVQFSSITPRSEIISGIKIKKEPRSRNGKNYNPRLIKKSTSYKIIESESILKVTDMTSGAQDITTETVIDEALTCSLPKSKSLFEVSIGPDKNKLLAFYCDDFVKPDDNISNNCSHEIPYCSHSCHNGCHRVKPFCIYSKCNVNRCCNSETCPGEPDFVCTDFTPTTDDYELCDNSSSSVCIDIDSKSFDKKITIRNRNGMGFWEGCLYCSLLWIPLLLISWLFYIHVIKDLVQPKHRLLQMLSLSQGDKTNASLTDIPISLADLGFY